MWFIAQFAGLLLLPVISLAMFACLVCSLQWHKLKD
ncbi:hypothetical protein swp_0732 [Shewanella piezotolerans WP3]|uniref:Uncharacterized protein n=1 Tax=Shewanella piezotolerans (strain WP3 / JCM 13877) TaxID=225849 RepID=B8CIS1_SHEPW|nr:hypothetical protein swp_0732 [Shewanella piezotolerans WP3]